MHGRGTWSVCLTIFLLGHHSVTEGDQPEELMHFGIPIFYFVYQSCVMELKIAFSMRVVRQIHQRSLLIKIQWQHMPGIKSDSSDAYHDITCELFIGKL